LVEAITSGIEEAFIAEDASVAWIVIIAGFGGNFVA